MQINDCRGSGGGASSERSIAKEHKFWGATDMLIILIVMMISWVYLDSRLDGIIHIRDVP